MNMESAIYLGVAGLGMVAASFLLGRRTGGDVARRLELEAELTSAHREQARLEAEAERLRNEIETAREEHEDYRINVVDHFSGTSDLLRDLTVQYRSVYEHLTRGASTLCPEGFVGLTEGLPPPQLAEPQADLEVAPEDLEEEPEPGAVTDEQAFALSEDVDRAIDALDEARGTAGTDPTETADENERLENEETQSVPISV